MKLLSLFISRSTTARRLIAGAALIIGLAPLAPAQILYVANSSSQTIGSYHLDGSVINTSFINTSSVGMPTELAVSGSTLYVATINSIISYDLNDDNPTGTTLISGIVGGSVKMAVSGATLYVAEEGNGSIRTYNANNGTLLNAGFVTGLGTNLSNLRVAATDSHLFVANATASGGGIQIYDLSIGTPPGQMIANITPTSDGDTYGMAVSGDTLFTAHHATDTVNSYQYSTATAYADPLIAGLGDPRGLAVFGSTLYVANSSTGTIGSYNLDGSVINASLITGISGAYGLAIGAAAVPEPASYALMLGLGGLVMAGTVRYRRRQSGSQRNAAKLPQTD